ncbi:hypothetical protein [Paraburkholderia sp. BL21I4N1]|uniref:hypothetical protein n=1 Tax=Paraburkholderia sp. BL21I4N1 TaxID=1938801 RepID=UPI0035BE19B4
MDTGTSRTAASSCATTASLALLTPGRFVTGGDTTLAALTGSARAAELVKDFFPATGATLTVDVFLAEESSLASVTFFRVGSFEPVPAALFPPVVFAIASPFAYRPLLGKPFEKQTAGNLLLYHSDPRQPA